MRTVSDATAFPRDDRAWPQGAFAFSLLCGLGALAGSAALVASADSLGRATTLVIVFVLTACLQAAAYIDAVTPWLQGRPLARHSQVIEFALVILAFAMFAGGADMGGAALCGLLAGVFLPNASTIRYARVNRSLVDEGEARLLLERSATPPGSADRPVRARPFPKVGPVLGETLSEERDRWLAWAAATVTVAVGCRAAEASAEDLLVIVLLGVGALVWVSRRLFGVWVALRDFETAARVPHRAYVVLLHDPSPRAAQPLLGVWSEEPLPSDSRLPRAEAVYRCDAERKALLSMQGGAVVHEAWMDTGPRARSLPRWVAADAGIALPHRRAVLGRRHLASVLGTERPARARSLTMPAPNPTRETETGTFVGVISEAKHGTGRWARMFAWRLAALTLVALGLLWLG